MFYKTVFLLFYYNVFRRCLKSRNIKMVSGGGPIHTRVPIHAHPQFSQRFVFLHGKNVYHIIDNYQIDHIH